MADLSETTERLRLWAELVRLRCREVGLEPGSSKSTPEEDFLEGLDEEDEDEEDDEDDDVRALLMSSSLLFLFGRTRDGEGRRERSPEAFLSGLGKRASVFERRSIARLSLGGFLSPHSGQNFQSLSMRTLHFGHTLGDDDEDEDEEGGDQTGDSTGSLWSMGPFGSGSACCLFLGLRKM